MLRAAEANAKPDIKRVVDDLLLENTNYDRNENRSAHREYLVRAVTVELRDSDQKFNAFSRNISPLGMGIITDQPVPERAVALLKISRIHGPDVMLLADCRWCKSYGQNWHLSGWQFLSLRR